MPSVLHHVEHKALGRDTDSLVMTVPFWISSILRGKNYPKNAFRITEPFVILLFRYWSVLLKVVEINDDHTFVILVPTTIFLFQS